MKTNELIGPLLDEWVARALGLRVELRKHSLVPHPVMLLVEGNGDFVRGIPQYSTDWAQGGPIIERERIQLEFHDWHKAAPWCAQKSRAVTLDERGPTPLIAAMRAFVACTFGDTVPDEVS